MITVRRALATVAVSGTVVAGVAVAGATAALAGNPPAPTSLSISAPHRVTFGAATTVSGTLSTARGKKVLASQPVTLEERAPGAVKWTPSGTQNTDASGIVKFTLSPARTMQVELVHAAATGSRASSSATATIKVAYAVSATLNGDTLTVTVAPTADKQKVLLQTAGRHGKHNRWSAVQTKRLAGKSQATFAITPPKAKGAYSYRVVKLAAHGFLGGASNTVQLTVP